MQLTVTTVRNRDRNRWHVWTAAGALAALLVASSCALANPSPAPVGSGNPPSGAPPATPLPAGPPSSQGLIAADLEAGTIDFGTSLELRAWALFGDPRLPERYDGSGSSGEDATLFDDIATNLDSLPVDKHDELGRYLLRPTDSQSPFSATTPAGTGSGPLALAGVLTAQETPTDDECAGDKHWFYRDWTPPGGSAGDGFRVWGCAANAGQVRADFDIVVAIGSDLWPKMTLPEPQGMGRPVPDAYTAGDGSPRGDGNGKVDIYLVDAIAECRQRGENCETIPGDAVAAAQKDWPLHCGVEGSPASGCSAYMLLGRSRTDDAEFAGQFAHEFFHVLQFAHNGRIATTWYHEASAVWAGWYFAQQSYKAQAYARFQKYQADNRSLLWYDYDALYQYQAWGWPLFQSTEGGPSNVFQTWTAIEAASSPSDVDSAINDQVEFGQSFRDFAVRNAQPAAYIWGSSTGLDDERWQKQPDLGDFPTDPHMVTSVRSALALGKDNHSAVIAPLTAQYDEYEVVGDEIRQIEIDITELTGAESADLDVLAQIRGSGDRWRRIEGSGGKVKLCRDVPNEDVNTALNIVISNHAFDRSGDLPDTTKSVKGNYTIEAKNKCDERELHLGGTITWSRESTLILRTPETPDWERHVTVSGRADVVLLVTDSGYSYRLMAERDGGSTYSYDYSFHETDGEDCDSHETGTLETYAGVPDADFGDWSIGRLNPIGGLFEDVTLDFAIHDWCGPSMGKNIPDELRNRGFDGFIRCPEDEFQLTAEFDGSSTYIVNCSYEYDRSMEDDTDTGNGQVSGTLTIIDGPHPTPR
jgi:hypothetical protein